jgi:hypothetical protein
MIKQIILIYGGEKYTKGADLRHTPHGSPQTIPIYGRNLRPYGATPIIGICSFLGVVIVRL